MKRGTILEDLRRIIPAVVTWKKNKKFKILSRERKITIPLKLVE